MEALASLTLLCLLLYSEHMNHIQVLATQVIPKAPAYLRLLQHYSH
jgi:hypothetical protein